MGCLDWSIQITPTRPIRVHQPSDHRRIACPDPPSGQKPPTPGPDFNHEVSQKWKNPPGLLDWSWWDASNLFKSDGFFSPLHLAEWLAHAPQQLGSNLEILDSKTPPLLAPQISKCHWLESTIKNQSNFVRPLCPLSVSQIWLLSPAPICWKNREAHLTWTDHSELLF